MTAPLRPMNLGEILDHTFQIYRSRFVVFVGIAAFPVLATEVIKIIGYLLVNFGPEPNLSYEFRAAARELGDWLISGNLESLLRCFIWPVLVYVASRGFIGEESTTAAIIRLWKSRWRSYLLIMAVLWVVWFLLPHQVNRLAADEQAIRSARLAIMGGSSPLTERIGGTLILLSEWIVEAILVVSLSPGIPIWTIEGLPPHRAMLRGWTLAKGSRLRILATWFVAAVVQGILVIASSAALAIFLRLIVGDSHRWDLYNRSYQAIALLPVTASSILIAPLYPIALTLFYYDQRIRHEGFDIERMMETAGMIATATPSFPDDQSASAIAEEAHT
jgi:hypothetical protein